MPPVVLSGLKALGPPTYMVRYQTPLSPDPLAYAEMRRPLKYFADGSGVKHLVNYQ